MACNIVDVIQCMHSITRDEYEKQILVAKQQQTLSLIESLKNESRTKIIVS